MFLRSKPFDMREAMRMLVKGRLPAEVLEKADALKDKAEAESIHGMVNEWLTNPGAPLRYSDLIHQIEICEGIERTGRTIKYVIIGFLACVLLFVAYAIYMKYHNHIVM